LKKQSQFGNDQIGVSSYLKVDYGNIQFMEKSKTKPKQTQFIGEARPAQAIPIPIQDNRDEAATQKLV